MKNSFLKYGFLTRYEMIQFDYILIEGELSGGASCIV